MFVFRLKEIIRANDISDEEAEDLLRIIGEAEIIAKLQLVASLLERLEHGKAVTKELLIDLKRDLQEELETLWLENPFFSITYEVPKQSVEEEKKPQGLSESMKKKVKELMRTVKSIASELDEKEAEDVKRAAQDLIADIVASAIGEEASITVDLDAEKVIIKEGD